MAFNKARALAKIENCKTSIKSFESEITQQRKIITEYQDMVDSDDSPFPVESLKRGIVSAKKNIQTIENSIQTERDSIQNLYNQIDINQEQELIEKEKKAHIEIIIEREDE